MGAPGAEACGAGSPPDASAAATIGPEERDGTTVTCQSPGSITCPTGSDQQAADAETLWISLAAPLDGNVEAKVVE